MDFKQILTILSGPIIGAIIGLITNGIAIRMLFRPLRPVKIGRLTLPFTPGIIPKERGRIAKACGKVIGETLINQEVLKANLLSDEMTSKVSSSIDTLFKKYEHSKLTLNETLQQIIPNGKSEGLIAKSEDLIVTELYRKACSIGLGQIIGDVVISEVEQSSAFKAFSFLISQDTINNMQNKIAEMVDEAIVNRGEELIAQNVTNIVDHYAGMTLEELFSGQEENIKKFKEKIVDGYTFFIKQNLGKILSAIDLSTLVENRINAFDIFELEKILLNIMNKELKAIVWFGGLLGLIMGIIMNFI